jgi:DNA-directed RNA polymerase subunit L
LELSLVSKDKEYMVIEFTDVKETLVHPLVDKLLSDNDVIIAAYKTGHPQLDKPRLTVKTTKVKPETAIKKAAESLEEEVKLLKKEFEKTVKSVKTKKAAPKKKKSKTTKAKAAIPKKKSAKKKK